ncbi:oxygenase MpaB family protein [Occallatibacter savannae]|uniref:oxygenase MpaB family protein n=1 Tax=Occallatibacter savannae TaxID=1002691 RepID=UPI000D691E87|nr:oxygenase MpaB family protein [Occallatibacter savannae]
MEQPHRVNAATEATRPDLERHIASVAALVQRPIEGIFGSDSVSWRINRESALFLGAGRAALLQLAHPWVAAALDQHASLLAKPIARFHNTFRVVFTMIFGTADQAFSSARSLYQMHTRITGEIPDAVAGYEKGSRYEALHIPALKWVYATLIESAVIAYECVLPPLTPDELAHYYGESKILAGLFGLPPAALPETWTDFKAYIADMFASEALGVSDRSRYMANRIMTGSGSWIHIPLWYQSLTAEWLPPRFRDEFQLRFGPHERSSATRAHSWLPRVYSRLPDALRYVGPYQEAHDRLRGRAANFLARRSNTFWIGQPTMPSAR